MTINSADGLAASVDVAEGPDGQLALVGRTTGTLITTVEGVSNAFVVVYDAEGKLLFEDQFGGSNSNESADNAANGVAFAEDGSVYVAGRAASALGDDTTFSGYVDAFLRKYSPEGEVLWTRMWGGIDQEYVVGIGVDEDGDVYVAGQTRQEGWLEPTFDSETFVVKYGSDGSLLWRNQYPPHAPAPSSEYADTLIVAPNGQFYVLSSHRDVWYIHSYDDAGKHLNTAVGTGMSFSSFMAFDGTDFYVLGYIQGEPNRHVFGKYDASANKIWSTVIGESEGQETTAYRVAVEPTGELLVVGRTDASLAKPNEGGSDAFIQRYSNDGQLLSTEQFSPTETPGSLVSAFCPLEPTYWATTKVLLRKHHLTKRRTQLCFSWRTRGCP